VQYEGAAVNPVRALLAAVAALCVLHFILTNALYATRIPAMIKMRMKAQTAAKPGALDTLPDWARNVAKNYNNLCEAPTVFYAIVFVIVLAGLADGFYVWLAWGYVALRYVHSLIQSTVNIVLWRFGVFVTSWVVLGVMVLRSMWELTNGVWG
jgi:hypothetical protein